MAKLPILLLMAAIGPPFVAQTASIDPAPSAQAPSAQAGGNPQVQDNQDEFHRQRLSLVQFEQLLRTLRGERDPEAARRLAEVVLIERASSARLASWQSEFPGQRTRQALLAVADASAFLDPPSEDTPSTPIPEMSALSQMVTRAVEYVNNSLPRLPDFSAQRITTRFELATPAELKDQQEASSLYQLTSAKIPHHELGPANPAMPRGVRLYFLETWQRTVTFRDGREVEDALPASAKSRVVPPLGLTTRGEFGPILYVVLVDAMKGKITWAHWEQSANGSLAVFRYQVPRQVSRYALQMVPDAKPDFPAYHGEIAIDPATGTIFRITIQSSAVTAGLVSESAILVEYGPVLIGNKSYISPLRGVATFQSDEAKSGEHAASADPPPFFLNDVSFAGYHVFRAETHILPATGPEP